MKLPFYCWECLTLSTSERDINLVIKDEKEMRKLLEFLIVEMKTIDGRRGSASAYLDSPNLDRDAFYLKVFGRFNLLRIRMKISYMALMK